MITARIARQVSLGGRVNHNIIAAKITKRNLSISCLQDKGWVIANDLHRLLATGNRDHSCNDGRQDRKTPITNTILFSIIWRGGRNLVTSPCSIASGGQERICGQIWIVYDTSAAGAAGPTGIV
jgi:hypothetical protein